MIVNRKQRRSPKFKTQLNATAKIMGTDDMKVAEEVLVFAMECKLEYGTQLKDTVETIADLKAGAGDEYELSWLMDQVRKGLEERRATITGLVLAGVDPGVARDLAGEVEKLGTDFGIGSAAALDYVVKAINGGQSLTADDMKEIALQLDADRETEKEETLQP